MQRSFKGNKVAEFDINLKYNLFKAFSKGHVEYRLIEIALIHMNPFRFAKYFIKIRATTHDASVGTLALLP